MTVITKAFETISHDWQKVFVTIDAELFIVDETANLYDIGEL